MERYKFDAERKTLVMSAGFARAVADTRTAEYKMYKRMLSEIPGLQVERKTHASPTSYKGKMNGGKRTPYYPTKNLSYERMEKFMDALDGGKKYRDEYDKLREKAEAMCLAPYAPVAHWFMAQFPEFRKNALFYIKPEHLPDVVDYAAFLEKVA